MYKSLYCWNSKQSPSLTKQRHKEKIINYICIRIWKSLTLHPITTDFRSYILSLYYSVVHALIRFKNKTVWLIAYHFPISVSTRTSICVYSISIKTEIIQPFEHQHQMQNFLNYDKCRPISFYSVHNLSEKKSFDFFLNLGSRQIYIHWKYRKKINKKIVYTDAKVWKKKSELVLREILMKVLLKRWPFLQTLGVDPTSQVPTVSLLNAVSNILFGCFAITSHVMNVSYCYYWTGFGRHYVLKTS